MQIKRGNDINLNNDEVEFLRLKNGESARICFYGIEDYISYPAHNNFNYKIYPQACYKILGEEVECPYCVASKNGVDDLKMRERMVFVFHNIETNKLVYWECTKNQGFKIINQLNAYKEDIEHEVGAVFEFTRIGDGSDTGYTLSTIQERKFTEKDKKCIKHCKAKILDIEDFTMAVQPKHRTLAIILLSEIGFDVEKHFEDAKQILEDLQETKKD